MLIKHVIQRLSDLGGNQQDTPCLDRRGFLKVAAVAAGGLMAGPALARVSSLKEQARSLAFYNTHTGENLRLVYWAPKEGYLRQALREVNWALRDHHTDKAIAIDPTLLDLMHAMQLKLGTRKPFHVISAYRSPETNAMLRRRSRRVAKNSYHMEGKAVDLRLPGFEIGDLRRAALALETGGVGYYPRSGYVHVDTGPVRSWRA